jgi:formylglycine-generating enzyme required for sulfatase activity
MTANGQEEIRSSLGPPPRGPAWASAFGQDALGYWAELQLDDVLQRLRFIPAGAFWMGSPDSEPGRRRDELRRRVAVEVPFWLADTACTQALWHAVTGQQPSQFRGENLPVEQVSWDAVNARFLTALNRRVPRLNAMLPTEAQWEYACRAGTETAYHWGDGPIPPGRCQHEFAQPRQTVPVCTFEPNPWGLWQLHGNVMEWCAHDSVLDGRREDRVSRGGSWNSDARTLRSACRVERRRSSARNDLGFRLAAPVAG